MKIKFIISFDIDGTLGRHESQITPLNDKYDIMDYSNIIEIKNYSYGDFIFYKGIIGLLNEVNDLVTKNGGAILITTAGLGEMRNITIINYINKLLNRIDDPLYLYDITYQTFDYNLVQNSINTELTDAWTNWFKIVLKNHDVSSLNVVKSDEPFSHFYYRDHQYIVNKHPERYNNLSISNILHFDDMPHSVKTLNKDGTMVRLVSINANHHDKIEECAKVLNAVKTFIDEKN